MIMSEFKLFNDLTPFLILIISNLLGFILLKFPFFKVNSGLKKFDFITLILFSFKIFINSFKIAASPNFDDFKNSW